jgi:uncharacterized protein (TIRG00374 family)
MTIKSFKPAKLAIILIKIIVTCITIFALAKFININSLIDKLMVINSFYVFISVVLAYLQILINTKRLQYLVCVRKKHLNFSAIAKISIIGYFYSQTLVSFIGGDGIRVWLLTKKGIPLKDSMHIIFIDRFMGLLSICISMLISIPFIWTLIDQTSQKISLLLLSICGPIALIILLTYHKVHSLFEISSASLVYLDELSRSANSLLFQTSISTKLLLYSLLALTINSIIVYVLFLGLNIDVTIQDALFLSPTVFLLSMMPFSFSGWGVREAAMASAFSIINVPAEISITVSVAFGLIFLFVSIPGAFLLFTYHDKK